jgi:hypothetical protein
VSTKIGFSSSNRLELQLYNLQKLTAMALVMASTLCVSFSSRGVSPVA